ncbi:MAG TPA: C-GCAxxG-C-C family protein [Verrucomicrobiae bacterium]
MKQHALAVFRQPPHRLNCAQSVLHAFREVTGEIHLSLADFQRFGGGRAPDGLCGALHAACAVVPEKAEALKSRFAARLGSLYCRELRAARQHPCEVCVSHAAELVEAEAGIKRTSVG